MFAHQTLLVVIADRFVRATDRFKMSPRDKSVRKKIAQGVWLQLTLFMGMTPLAVLQAFRDLADLSPNEVWLNAKRTAAVLLGEGTIAEGMEGRLVRWLAAIPQQTRQHLETGGTRGGSDDVGEVLPGWIPRNLPTDLFLTPDVRLELRDPLHVGPFSEVWTAQANDHSPVVVVKRALTPRSARYLRREAKVLRHLQKSGVEGILYPDWTLSRLTGSDPGLTFPFMEEGTLAAYLALRGGSLPSEEVHQVILPQLLRTFRAFHDLKPSVVHGDAKPQNLFVRRDEHGNLRVLVGDFGASGRPKPVSGWGFIEPTEPRAYTPSYAPLEQKEGDPYSPSDDVHALAVIWCKLIGVNPFQEDDLALPTGTPWERRLRPRLAEELREAGLEEAFAQAILAALGPAWRRPSCEGLLDLLHGVRAAS